MPELPEVEVVKRSLERTIKNFVIKDIEINEVNLRYRIKKYEIKQIIGKSILNIKRRSKYLLFFFNKGVVMIVHLGMTGKFFLENKSNVKKKTSFYYNLNDEKDTKHNHIIFTFKNRSKLIYNDVRKFGFIKFDTLTKYSKIKPNRKACNLNITEIKNILKNTKKILIKAIYFGGSSIRNFLNSNGKTGDFQQHFAVYGRKGNKCSNTDCNGKIKRIVTSNRASFFCPNCQK